MRKALLPAVRTPPALTLIIADNAAERNYREAGMDDENIAMFCAIAAVK